MPKSAHIKRSARWITVPFGKAVNNITERIEPSAADSELYVGLGHLESGTLTVRRWGSARALEGTKLRMRKGDVLFAKRNAYLKRVAIAPHDGPFSAHGMVLRANPDVMLHEFLPFFMQSDLFMDRALEISVGSLSPTINWKTLAVQEFALPPLDEQRRIAEVLQAFEAAISALMVVRKASWQAHLANNHYITGANAIRRIIEGKELTELRPHWKVSTLGEAVLVENRLRKPLSAKVRKEMHGPYPYFGATGKLDSISEYRIDGTHALIGEDGDHFLKYRKQSMTQLVSGRFNVNNHAHVIKGADNCCTKWFYHCFRHRDIRHWLTKQGSGRLKLKKATLLSMPILLPPMDQQIHLVEKLDSTVNAVESVEERILELKRAMNLTSQKAIGAV